MILSTRVVPEDQHPGGCVPKRVFLVWGVGGVEGWSGGGKRGSASRFWTATFQDHKSFF